MAFLAVPPACAPGSSTVSPPFPADETRIRPLMGEGSTAGERDCKVKSLFWEIFKFIFVDFLDAAIKILNKFDYFISANSESSKSSFPIFNNQCRFSTILYSAS